MARLTKPRFHRTPAEMAADANFCRSPRGESLSRHLLWLTDADHAQIGPEPTDRSSPGWSDWWGAVSTLHERRRREAMSDPAWARRYEELLQEKREHDKLIANQIIEDAQADIDRELARRAAGEALGNRKAT